ncbi:MAG: type II toxin-antitoxin system PemK/MazF family toxin [Candidatus Eremiobacterota bacterium]
MVRGEIWLIDLDPAKGAEMKKIRPAIIVSDDSIGILPLKVIVPITDWKDHYNIVPWMIKLDPDDKNGLHKISCADTFQIRSLSKERFIQKIGKISIEKMDEISLALSLVLNINP